MSGQSRGRRLLALGVALLGTGILANVLAAPLPDRTLLESLWLRELPAAPDDPSNAWQRSAGAAELGRQFFFDVRFSRNQAVACANCHDPARQFQDGLAVSQGVGIGTRRAMPLADAGHNPWLFWDGRKDSLWSQALGPLEDPLEQGSNRMRIARLVGTHYRDGYVAVFGALPEFSDMPEDASPLGAPAEQAAWRTLSATEQLAVTRVFANLGKAIAAYELTLKHEPSRLDRYIEGTGSLSPPEQRGLRIFLGKGQCVSCHNGPLLSDQQFHNTGVPPREPSRPDTGRSAAVMRVRHDEFNCLGAYSDARPEQCRELRFLAEDQTQHGAFRTPGLRGVARRPPYMHGGQFRTLEEVVRHYMRAPSAAVGESELQRRNGAGRDPIRLSPREQQDLVAFLHTL